MLKPPETVSLPEAQASGSSLLDGMRTWGNQKEIFRIGHGMMNAPVPVGSMASVMVERMHLAQIVGGRQEAKVGPTVPGTMVQLVVASGQLVGIRLMTGLGILGITVTKKTLRSVGTQASRVGPVPVGIQPSPPTSPAPVMLTTDGLRSQTLTPVALEHQERL